MTKEVAALIESVEQIEEPAPRRGRGGMSQAKAEAEIVRLEALMKAAARELEFEKAAELRDEPRVLREGVLGLAAPAPPARGKAGKRRSGRCGRRRGRK